MELGCGIYGFHEFSSESPQLPLLNSADRADPSRKEMERNACELHKWDNGQGVHWSGPLVFCASTALHLARVLPWDHVHVSPTLISFPLVLPHWVGFGFRHYPAPEPTLTAASSRPPPDKFPACAVHAHHA